VSQIGAHLGLIQRVLPNYRAPFFEALGAACKQGFSVIAGEPGADEAIETHETLTYARLAWAHNHHFLRGSAYLCWQGGVIAWLKDWDPEVLIVEANPRYLSTPAAVRWMHQRKRPVIGWGLGSPAVIGRMRKIRMSLRQSFLGQFDALITYSRQGQEEYIALGCNPQRIVVAPNAVAPRPQKPPVLRPPHYEGQPTVLYVGRLQERKRLDVLMHACAHLPRNLHPRLWIVGDGSVKASLEELAREVYPATQFFGSVFGTELEPIYAAADLFILPGTGGLAVQQAMAHGLPVIVAEADGTQLDLVRPQNGFLTPPGDIKQLESTLKMALEDPLRLRRMGAESYRIVAEEINLENMVAAFAKAIESVQK
jgi:glycosyltransferase involved in cell wall biosynthesis